MGANEKLEAATGRTRRPRIEVVDEPGGGVSILDHAARVAYPFWDREGAETALDLWPTPAELAANLPGAAADLYAELTEAGE